ncbi:hypothetical protein [Lacticaseibacillus saniviri]
MRKWQLGIALILSAIGLAVGTPHTVEATLVPGVQNNLDPNLKNMRIIPGQENSSTPNADSVHYKSNQGILAASGVGTGYPITGGSGTPASGIRIAVDNSVTGGNDNSANRWFVMNYIDAPKDSSGNYLQPYLDFSTEQKAKDMTPDNSGDQSGVVKKMNITAGSKSAPVLAPGQNYDGGILNVSGNVPIIAFLQKSEWTYKSLTNGNWGVMVKMTLPQDIDVKSIANAIMWDKAYFYLTVATTGGLSYNFPLMFDHHVYMNPDPAQKNTFFLKVKGIPFDLSVVSPWFQDRVTTFKLSSYADKTDVDNNLDGSGSTAKKLVNMTNLPNNAGYGTQTTNGNNILTSEWGLNSQTLFAPSNVFAGGAGTVNLLGPGTSGGSGSRDTGALNLPVIKDIVSAVVNLFTQSGLTGHAAINFNIDMSKYNGNLTSQYRPLTRARLFPSSKADGTFNQLGGDPLSQPAQLALYGTDALVNPHDSNTYQNMFDAPGTSPMDYAVVDKSKEDDPQYKITYRTTTNFTSWNSFVVPYDNRAEGTSTNPTTYYKTILPDTDAIPSMDDAGSQVGSTILSRTAQPDFYTDGVLVNTGTTYKGADPYQATSDTEINTALNTSPDLTKGLTGAVTPKRYTRAYSYFNFDPSMPTVAGTKVDPQEVTNSANVSFQATDKTAAQIAAGATSVVNPSSVATNASATGGTVSPLLGKPASDVWQLTGKYNSIPMLSAPLKLDQQIQAKTGNDDDKTLAIKRTDIADGKTFTKTYNSAWSDPFVTGNTPDDIWLKTTKNGSTNEVKIGQITSRQAELAPITFVFTTGTGTATASRNETTNTLTVNIPIGSTDTYNQYDLEFRPQALKVATTDGTNGYWNAQLDASNAGHFLLNVLIADDIQKTVAVTNYFYNSSADLSTNPLTDAFTQQFVGSSQTATKVNVKGIFHSNSNVVLSDVDLLIPQPAGITLPSTLQVNNKDGSSTGKTFTQVLDNPTLVSGYVHYRYTGANLPALPSGEDQSKDAEIYYSYTMTVDATKLANDTTPLTTEAISTANNKLTYMGEANTISLVKSTGVQLLSTPTLNFGKTWNADGTPQPYRLTKDSTASDVQFTTRPNAPVDFLFQYLDGNTTQTPNDSWSLTASLSNFQNQNDSSAAPQFGFKIDYGRGEPTQTNGTIIMADSYLTNDGRLDTGILSGEATKYAGTTSSVGIAHTANTMTSDSSSSVLYRSDKGNENRYLQPGTSQFKIRYDMTDTVNGVTTPNPAVKLTVPKAAFQTIKPGTYVSTASYTVNNALQ